VNAVAKSAIPVAPEPAPDPGRHDSCPPDVGGEVAVRIAEAAAWRLLGLLFERPRPERNAAIDAIAREVADPELRAAAEHASDVREGAYLTALGPGGIVSPREASYRGTEDPAAVLSDLAAFYSAFAFTPDAEDPIDHVAVEAGFAGYLKLKEAYALARLDLDHAAAVAESFDRFLRDHLNAMAGPFARRLERAEAGPLAAAARCLVARAGDRPDSLPMLPGDTDESSIRCPGSEEQVF
jgi:hypothetical protein